MVMNTTFYLKNESVNVEINISLINAVEVLFMLVHVN